MLLSKKNGERPCVFLFGLAAGLMAFLIPVWFCGSVSARVGGFYGATIWPSDAYKKEQKTYKSPEGAVRALIDALSANDEEKLLAVLGPKGKKLIFSGDEADAKSRLRAFCPSLSGKEPDNKGQQ